MPMQFARMIIGVFLRFKHTNANARFDGNSTRNSSIPHAKPARRTRNFFCIFRVAFRARVRLRAGMFWQR